MPLVREFRKVGKPPELIQALSGLWGQDKVIEKNLRRARIAFIACVLLIFAGAFLASATGSPLPVVLPIAGAAVCGVLWWRYQRLNLDDRRILTPIKLLEVLQADIAARDPVRLVVSFDDYRKHGRKLEGTGGWGAGRAKYEDTWLEVEGWLAERTRFRLVVTQQVSRSEKRKRKYTKVKERIREAVGLHLRPDRKVYGALDRFPAQFAAGENVAGLRIETARATERGVLLVAEGDFYTKMSGRSTSETGSENLVQGDKLLMLMAAVFERLGRCRAPASA